MSYDQKELDHPKSYFGNGDKVVAVIGSPGIGLAKTFVENSFEKIHGFTGTPDIIIGGENGELADHKIVNTEISRLTEPKETAQLIKYLSTARKYDYSEPMHADLQRQNAKKVKSRKARKRKKKHQKRFNR